MPIGAEFPFESKFIEVHGSKIHYVDEGEGDPVLFLHGNPTSSYLWRNIIPHMTPHARCIAPDLIGMGKSDKPDIGYRFDDHYRYITGFIESMGLQNITLVIHDWGSALGFHYARQNEGNVRAIAFMEALVRPFSWANFGGPGALMFRAMRAPVIGPFLVQNLNFFVNVIVPQSVDRKLSDEEMASYRAPYPTPASRKPVYMWPNEIPFDGDPADNAEVIEGYYAWLQQTDLPKLMFYANPGAIIPPELVQWCKDNLPNLKSVDIGKGIHYIQEDNPDLIGTELAAWYNAL